LLSHGTKILFIAIAAYILNAILARIIKRAVKIAVVPNKMMSEESERQRENTLIRIFTGVVTIVIMSMAIIMIINEFGIEIGPILAGAGIVGLAFGFGGQYLIKDLISGLFIILENQYRIGDVVSIAGTSGLVEDISLRMTTLRDMDGTVHHIPHGEVKVVSNLSKNYANINLNVSVAYSTNIEHIVKVVNRIGNEMAKDPKFRESINVAPKFLRIEQFADSAIIIKIVGETKPLKQWEITGELRKRIKVEFEKEGIEIPFPRMVIHQVVEEKKDEKHEQV
jgi:small conductance mechanosensitive channel